MFDGTPGGQQACAALGTHVTDVDRLVALLERSIGDGRAAPGSVVTPGAACAPPPGPSSLSAES